MNSLFTMVFIFGGIYGYSVGREDLAKLTRCSKFDFEEKLLEKLVRLEHKVELFEDKLNDIQNGIKNTDLATSEIEVDHKNKTEEKTLRADPVAITACSVNNQRNGNGYVVMFDEIKTQVGVTNVSSFTSTGRFTAEKPGVYLVSVSLTALDSLIDYYIYTGGIGVKGNGIMRVYEENNKVNYQRGSAVVTVVLQEGHTVWVQLNADMVVDKLSSCITLVKIG